MDNPWANAWDESKSKGVQDVASSVPTKSSFSTAWKESTENETDIALPSWSAGPAVTWNEPSDDVPSLWGSSAASGSAFTSSLSPRAAGWTSSYESLSAHLSRSKVSEDSETETSQVETSEDEEDEVEGTEQVEEQTEQLENTSEIVDPWTPQTTFSASTSTNTVLTEPAQTPGTPEVFEFGTFESGADSPVAAQGDTWDSTAPVADSEWGSAWAKEVEAKEQTQAQEEEVLDEWERARREKEKMDRAVPPEFLASILRTLEEISNDLVPPLPGQIRPKETDKPSSEVSKAAEDASGVNVESRDSSEQGTEVKVETEAKADNSERTVEPTELKQSELEHETEAWKEPENAEDPFNHWKGGMDAVESLSVLCDSLIPSLPPFSSLPALSFQSSSQPQSLVLKRSAEAVRLTRSTVISSSGPLGMYHKTKGSMEWEVAVKARPIKTTEEEREESVPVGWRIVPKEEEKKIEAPESKRKGTGILSSFFGRRMTTPVESKDAKEASPRPSFTSPRASVDSAPSKSDIKAELSSPPPKLPTNPVSAPTLPTTTLSPTSTPSNYGDGGSVDVFQDAPTTAPAPSAVSRFLNRFSRSRPNHTRQSSNDSLALSTNDLEFLEDIIPSASDVDSDTHRRNELQDMISSAPLPVPLLPPPRAPPQLSSPRSPADHFAGNIGTNGFEADFALNLTPSPAFPSPIQTTITQTYRSSTTSSFASPVSRSSTPLDLQTATGPSAAAADKGLQIMGTGGTGLGIMRPSLSNTKTNGPTTTKRPTPVAIMSSSISSSKTSINSNSFSFLPPPPSTRQSTNNGMATSSLLIDDELFPAVSSVPPVPAPVHSSSKTLSDDFDDDEFSDFHSGVADSSQPPFSPGPISLSSAQPLFSAGSSAFAPSADRGGPIYDDPLNTSVSSAASANSTSTMFQPISKDVDLFHDFGNQSPARATLRTPSPPALPAKSPGKVPNRKAVGSESLGVEWTGASGIVRRQSVGAKATGGTGIGGRVAPGRLNLPPPISSSALSKNWDRQGSSPPVPSGNDISSFVPSSSEPILSAPSSPSPKAHQRRVSKEAHQRTRSLVEEGIAKSRMWPSPAPNAAPPAGKYGSAGPGYGAYGFGTAPPLTPLPPILSPPPGSGNTNTGDLLGDSVQGADQDDDDVPLASLASGISNLSFNPTSSHHQVNAQATRMVPSISPDTNARNDTLPPIPLPGPASSAQKVQQTPLLMEFDVFGSNLGSSPAYNASSSTSTKTSGLSAQDLSFFEGL